MHTKTLADWQHDHEFAILHAKGKRRTTLVLIITALTMVAEIIAGTMFGSMSLLADGWVHLMSRSRSIPALGRPVSCQNPS